MNSTIRARIIMYAPANGGRSGPFNEGYCPHVVVEGKTEWLGVRVVRCPGFVYPEAEYDVEFERIYESNVDYRDLTVGTRFAIHEGPKIVGTGIVVVSN